MPVLYGVFLYMGYSAMRGMQVRIQLSSAYSGTPPPQPDTSVNGPKWSGYEKFPIQGADIFLNTVDFCVVKLFREGGVRFREVSLYWILLNS